MLNKFSGEAALDWLKKEYLSIRSSEANPGILDSVKVDMYGSKMPINQVASVIGEGPKSLRITPWDKEAVKLIDAAIREANLGVSVSVDERGLRISFPELTSEKRQMLIKLAKQKLEEARVRTRSEREKVLAEVEKLPGKDDVFRAKQELQKSVDAINKKLEELYSKKESEIMQ